MKTNRTAKPLSKSSRYRFRRAKRAADGGIAAENGSGNGLARAERTATGSVAADGIRTRYPGGTDDRPWNERALCVNLGGTAGFQSCPNLGTGLFLLSGKERSL